LLKNLGSLDYILEHPQEVPGKKKQETIVQESEKAKVSRKLVTIDTAIDFPKEPNFFKLKEPDVPKLKEFYASMNFNSLLRELDQLTEDESEEVTYVLVDEENAFQKLLEILSKQKEICFDSETTDIHPIRAELVGVGFGFRKKEAWYVPVNGKLGLKRVLEGIKPLLENEKIGYYGHNIKYDRHVMANHGIKIQNICFDTILASYILNTHSRKHSLDTLSLQYFGKVKKPITDLIGKGKQEISMREVPIEQVLPYCCEDVDYTCRLKAIFEKELTERKLTSLLYDLELPLTRVLAGMERRGIYLDVPCLQKMGKEVGDQIKIIEKEIYDLAGETVNLNSPKQLGILLFEKMQIPPPKKTATGYSTNVQVLETLKFEYPIAGKIIEYRILEKLRSTYIEALPQEVNENTHRIHPTFNQSIAATGRLTCQDPNLQNIPVRTELGRKIREAFRPEKQGWSYLSADYSQIELRLLAVMSNDPTLITAFQNHEDIHAHTASTVFNVPLDEVTREQRYQAKAVNFGIIYGQQAFGLARELGIDVKEANVFIEKYFERYPKVKEFLQSCKDQAHQTGKAVTLFGREREIPEINSKNMMLRSAAERLSVNTPFQGTAADLIKKAMLDVDHRIRQEKLVGYMILQVHDELIFEIPDFEIVAFEALVKEAMEKVLKLKIPLAVDISIGKNWREC